MTLWFEVRESSEKSSLWWSENLACGDLIGGVALKPQKPVEWKSIA